MCAIERLNGVACFKWGKLRQVLKDRGGSTPVPPLQQAIERLDTDYRDRKLWLDCWLTPAALPQSKRDLAKLGITSPAQMEQPLPKWIRCNVTAVVRRDDDGIERNKVQTFEAVGIDTPEADAFAPKPPGDAADPNGEADTSFDPSKL